MQWLEKISHYLFTPEGLQELTQMGGYAVLMGIVFAETGLLVGFFLPGDSLMFVTGFMAGLGHLDIWLLNVCLSGSAIVGDTVGYWIGARAGQAIYTRPDSRFFKKKHLIRTREFYERHGGKTIVLARFVPIVRTFAPVVAGVAGMDYRRFLFFNVTGGIGWVASLTTLGYYLGQFIWVQKNLEKVVLLVIAISLLPLVVEYFKHRKPAPQVGVPEPEVGTPPTGP